MAKQQHQNPSQGTSSTNQRTDAAQPQGAPADEAMDTGHRAGHVSSTDSMYGTHSSLGGADERGGSAEGNAHSSEATQSQSQQQPTRGGAQTGLTGSVGQLERGKSNQGTNKGTKKSAEQSAPQKGAREHEHAHAAGAGSGNPPASARSGLRGAQAAGDLDESARVRAGEAQGRSKYSPTANEQDQLSRRQGGEPLDENAPTDSANRSAPGPAGREGTPARGGNPREGGHGTASDDSPTVRSPADRSGKLTATHDIDLAGPDRSGTKRDR